MVCRNTRQTTQYVDIKGKAQFTDNVVADGIEYNYGRDVGVFGSNC